MTAVTGPRRVAAGLGLALRAVFAAAVTAGIVAGVPWLLLTQVGWPLPRHIPSTRAGWEQWLTNPPIDPEQFITGALACALWFFWAQFLLCVLAETWYVLRRQVPGRVRLAIRPVQGVTAGLVGAITLTLLTRPVPAKTTPGPVALEVDTGPAVPGAEGAHPGRPPAATPAAGPGVALTPGAYWTHPAPPATADGHGLRTYVVREHDSLWRIADRELADPLRWKDIYGLNHDRPQPDGERLTGPYYLIRVGWTLLLPGAAGGGPPVAAQHGRTVIVRPGDTLSSIAARELGDAGRWPQIWDLNRGRTQPDGRDFTDPDRIWPGWTLTLPGSLTGGSPVPPVGRRSAGGSHPDAPPGAGTAPGHPQGRGPATGDRNGDSPVSPGVSGTPPAPRSTASAPAGAATAPTAAPTGAPPATGSGSAPVDRPTAGPAPQVRLPGGGVVGLSVAAAISTAVGVWRLRRRLTRQRDAGDGDVEVSAAGEVVLGVRVEAPPAAAGGLEEAWLAAVRCAQADADHPCGGLTHIEGDAEDRGDAATRRGPDEGGDPDEAAGGLEGADLGVASAGVLGRRAGGWVRRIRPVRCHPAWYRWPRRPAGRCCWTYWPPAGWAWPATEPRGRRGRCWWAYSPAVGCCTPD